jgi:hypothetical protein
MGIGPGFVLFENLFIGPDGDGTGRAECRATAAPDAFRMVLGEAVLFRNVGVCLVGTLTNANFAANARCILSIHDEFVK